MTDKTIFMPAALADAWLAALRSGEYKQCFGLLARDDGYCCMGVLQLVADGDVERNGMREAYGSPSSKWLHEHGIRFISEEGYGSVNPFLKRFNTGAMDANDLLKASFPAIADAIEACLERT